MQSWIVTVVLVAGLPAVARAQQPEGSDALAERYYKLGEELYHRSDYEGALKQFGQSHKHSKKPALLFNIARCYESLGRHQDAIEAFEGYLKSNPENTEQVRARVANLQRLVDRKRAEQQNKDEAARQRQAREAERQRQAEPKRAAPRTDTKRTDTKRGSPLLGWIVAGSGGALIVTSVVFGILAADKASKLEDAASRHEPYADHRLTEDQGQASQAVQVITLIAGGAALASGAVLLTLHYLKRERPAAARAWIAPSVTPRGGYLAAGLRF